MKKSDIEDSLDSAHAHLSRAAFLLVVMIVKRTLWRSYIEEAIKHISVAQERLGVLHDRSKKQ